MDGHTNPTTGAGAPRPMPGPAAGQRPAAGLAAPRGASPPPRRGLWPLLLALALVLAVGLHLGVQRGTVRADAPPGIRGPGVTVAPGEVPAEAPVAAGSGVASDTGRLPEPSFGKPAEAAARVGRAASAALATARAAAGLAPRPPAERVFDLCGVGRLTIPEPPASGPDATFEALPRPLGLFARQQAWARLLPLMDQPDQPERVRAAALVLRASGLLDAEATPSAPQGTASTELAAMQASTRALARLARGSRDPYVLSWALALCDRVLATDLAPCRRISPRDLAGAAPEEAQAWLLLAAMPGLSAAQRQAAMEQAAAADSHGSLDMQLPAVLDSVWPGALADWPDYLRLQLLVQAIGVDVSLGANMPLLTARLCDANALQDPAQRPLCEGIARQLQTHARNLLQLNLAAGLGSRLGWPEQETTGMRAEAERLLRYTPESEPAGQPFSCPAVQDIRQWVQSLARDGELAELRRRASQSTPTPTPAPAGPQASRPP
jgi:hypothetical protein